MQYLIYKYKGAVGEKIKVDDLNTIADARFICGWIKNVHPEIELEIWKQTKNDIYLKEVF